MRRLARKPDYLVRTIFDIDVPDLLQRGIKGIAFDVDNTLGLMGCTKLDKKTEEFLVQLHQLGFQICFASNSRRDFSAMVSPFGGKIVQPRANLPKKPHFDFFKKIIEVMGVPASEIAVAGDKLLHDIVPAQHLGMVTILVTPLGRDLLIEVLIARRYRERRQMRRFGIRRPL